MEQTSTPIRVIETTYNGYRFRSRLEARWAVFFDALDIKFWYEPNGYTFEGICYLPDFLLPQVDMFAEVKADFPGADEIAKASGLSAHLGKSIIMLIGPPDFIPYLTFFRSPHDPEIQLDNVLLDIDYHGRKLFNAGRLFGSIDVNNFHGEDGFTERYRSAVYASRSARFDAGDAAKCDRGTSVEPF